MDQSRIVDFLVALLLIKGELSTECITIGKSRISITVNGSPLDSDLEQIINLSEWKTSDES